MVTLFNLEQQHLRWWFILSISQQQHEIWKPENSFLARVHTVTRSASFFLASPFALRVLVCARWGRDSGTPRTDATATAAAAVFFFMEGLCFCSFRELWIP